MKSVFLVLFVCFALILRLNLPDNSNMPTVQVSGNTGIVSEIKTQMFSSGIISDWTYTDLLFVKFACSKNLKTKLLGLPFKRWETYETDVHLCK